ncbi:MULTISPECIES: YiiD C-terminal domain-containing protein [Marinobacter]|uniref:YiiD C-terminal domain-containing protein n=1 Tax=Marinobacter TaxID=2742 RepID=UPI000DAD83A9|nr:MULTISPECIES: YiiD C-terminal domain-containing protein [Marinobacter]
MIDLDAFQARIHEQIPLTRALGVTLEDFDGERLSVRAPLEENHNHQGTGFGGSLYAVAVTAAWSLLELWLAQRDLNCRVVVQSGSMDYGLPVSSDFYAQCALPVSDDLERLERSIERRGKGRVTLESTIFAEEGGTAFPAATFSGRFVVVRE